MLTIVKLVLLVHPIVAALEETTHTISNFLGPSRFLSLRDACQFGSIPLLNWIWVTSCVNVDDRTSRWSLNNFLRSDPHYYKWQFSKSLKVAAGRGDLPMVKWIFEHFAGCEAPASVADQAKEKGYLDVLLFLWNCRSQKRDWANTEEISPGSKIFAQGRCTVQTGWIKSDWFCGKLTIEQAIENGQFVQYFNNVDCLALEGRDIAINHAFHIGNAGIVKMLLPTDKPLLDFATDCPRKKMIEWMLECRYLQHNEDAAASMIPTLVCNGQLDFAHCILQLHSPFKKDHKKWISAWENAIQRVCKYGTTTVLQWLIESPTGKEACDSLFKNNWCRYGLLGLAAKHGNVAVMEYLDKQELHVLTADEFNGAMLKASENGHLSAIKWMIDHYSDKVSISKRRMIGASAEYGHLETVKFFYDLDDGKVETDSWWCDAADPIYYAAEGGHLAVIEWILTNRSPKCTVGILEKAAANNHLDVVKWLHSNRSEGCALWAIAGAARNGHVDMMQWLHVNYPNKFNSWCTGATYGAAEHGHLKAIKWLYENLREDRACEAIDKAIRTDHIHVADWLQSRFPEFVVGSSVEPHKQLLYVTARANTFETLLYLHVRCAYVFTPSFLQRLRRDLTLFIDDLPLITSWLDEHYPVDI